MTKEVIILINNKYQLIKLKYKMVISIFEIYKLYLSKEQYVQLKKSINKIDFNKSFEEIEKDIKTINKNLFSSIFKLM